MRNIKFRAWDKELKCFSDVVAGNLLNDIHQHGGFQDKEDEHRFEISQSTERNDRNGKTIFEGDILDHSDGNCKVQYDPATSSYEVIFVDEGVLSLWEATGWGRNELSIIGNIYENPDMFVF